MGWCGLVLRMGADHCEFDFAYSARALLSLLGMALGPCRWAACNVATCADECTVLTLSPCASISFHHFTRVL